MRVWLPIAASDFARMLLCATLMAAPAATSVAQDQSDRAQTAATPSQIAPGTPDPNASSAGEIVVTARKRQETIRDVPSTLSAITAGQLAAQGPIDSTGDLLRTVPGVRFNNLQAPNLSEISIRGSGTQRATGADSGVGLFFNGAYVGSSTLGGRNFRNVDFFDPERVEVLKGPQGGLYGRNSEYGTVNIVSAKPSFTNTGYVDETFISGLDQNQLTAVVNVPVNDEVAVRLGAESFLQDGGFYKNPDNGAYYDRTEGWIVRGQVRWRRGPLDVNLLVDAQDLHLPVFVTDFVVQPGTVPQVPLGFTNDRYSVPSNGVNGTRQVVQRAMLTVDYDLGWARVTSTTLNSYFFSRQDYEASADLAQEARFQAMGEVGLYPLNQVTTRVKDNTLYEDLHAGGSLVRGRVTWLLGAEVLSQRDSNGRQTASSPCPLTTTSGICGGTPAAPICYQLLPTSRACPAVFPGAFGTDVFSPLDYLSEAGYGSLKFDLGHNFTLSGDLRYTSDDKTAAQYPFNLYTLTPQAGTSNFDFNSSRTNYTVTLSYLIPGAWRDLLYVKTGTGYRAGGVNPGVSSPAAPVPFQPTYGDENTTSYEAGLKGNITHYVYFTIAGYESHTDNAIAAVNDGCSVVNACRQPATTFNINGGEVHAHGVEASLDTRFDLLGGHTTLGLTAANQEATYVSVRGSFAGLPVVGSSVAQLPDWNASGTLDYAHPIVTDVDGFFHMVWNGQWGGVQDTVTVPQPRNPLENFNDVSLRTGVNWRKLQVAFFVQNLLNQGYAVLKLENVGGSPLANRYNQPRTYGLNAVYRW